MWRSRKEYFGTSNSFSVSHISTSLNKNSLCNYKTDITITYRPAVQAMVKCGREAPQLISKQVLRNHAAGHDGSTGSRADEGDCLRRILSGANDYRVTITEAVSDNKEFHVAIEKVHVVTSDSAIDTRKWNGTKKSARLMNKNECTNYSNGRNTIAYCDHVNKSRLGIHSHSRYGETVVEANKCSGVMDIVKLELEEQVKMSHCAQIGVPKNSVNVKIQRDKAKVVGPDIHSAQSDGHHKAQAGVPVQKVNVIVRVVKSKVVGPLIHTIIKSGMFVQVSV